MEGRIFEMGGGRWSPAGDGPDSLSLLHKQAEYSSMQHFQMLAVHKKPCIH